MKTAISEKGQVTIPKALRDRLAIRAGDTLEWSEEQGRLIAVKATNQDCVEAVYGILSLDGGTDELIKELRGPAEAT